MRLSAALSALLVSASAFAQTPQDPTAPDTRVLDARIRALERASSAGSGPLIRVNTSAGVYVVYTNPATLTLQADGGYLRTAGSTLLDPPWRNPVVWFPAGGGSSTVYVDPATLSGDGSSPAVLRRLAWRGAYATNGILGTGTASDPLRILPTYLPGGEGFPLDDDVSFASNSASDVGGLQFVGSTNRLESDGINLIYGGVPLAAEAVEADPVWLSEKSGYATGTPVYAESDPVWNGVEPGYSRWDALGSNGYVFAANPSNEAGLVLRGTNWVASYAARASIPYSTWLSAVQSNLAAGGCTSYPGTLVSSGGGTWSLKAELDHAAYSNANPGSITPSLGNATWWLPFASKGDVGAPGSGVDGDDGLDGIGNIRFGPYDNTKAYAFDTNLPVVVSYDGRWYECLQSSTGVVPGASAPATNYWRISVDKGDDGEMLGFTNLVYRGPWDVELQYETNDLVTYFGNLYAVSTRPAVAVAPSLGADYVAADSAWWTALVSRGIRGQTGSAGADGQDGSYVTNLFQSYVDDPAFNRVTNSPSATNRFVRFESTDGVSNFFLYSALLGADLPAPAFVPTNYAAAGPTYDGHLAGIDAKFAAPAAPDGFAAAGAAVVSGGRATVWLASNAWWTLDLTGQNRLTNATPWDIVTNGWSGLGLAAFGLRVATADQTNTFSWPSASKTNAPAPAPSSTNFYFVIWNGAAWESF